MTHPNELLTILERILNGCPDEGDIAILRQSLKANGGQNVVQLGKYNVNIGEGKDIQIGDKIYQGTDAETIRTILLEVLSQNTRQIEIDWHDISQAMLSEQQRLTTNPLTSSEGITYRTEQVYVPLELVKRKKPTRRREDVSPEQGSELYREKEITQTFEHQQFLEQVLRQRQSPKSQGRRIAIIGEPGAGKTTLLQQMAQWVSGEMVQSVVIWVSLADLRSRELESYLLEIWLQAVARKVGQAEASTQVKDNFMAQFNQGLVWLLLDGVDEMQATVGNPLGEIERQIRTGTLLQQARIVVSCRLNLWDGGSNALDSFDNYRTLEFSYPQQVKQFIGNWFGSLPSAETQTGQRLSAALREQGKERIRDLAKNPLRLTLLCFNWYLGEGKLPETKAGLYEQFVADFYEWKKGQFATTGEQRKRLNAALGELAREAIDKEAARFRLRHDFVCEFLGEPDDADSLFGLALRLGWLNKVGVEAENPRKGVYGFFHPTFEEYFAALAIEDWHYFLNHIPENPSHPDASYRIFEPQWKEVFLLWLGQKSVSKEKKENLIQALVKFEDKCNEFYWEQAVFLAAAGIAEFKCFIYDKKIVEQLILWTFGYFDIQKQEWLEALTPLREEARKALIETNRGLAIVQIIDFIQDYPDGLYARYRAIQILGEIGSEYPEVLQLLSDLLCSSQDKRTIVQTAETWARIVPNHREAIAILFNVLEDEQEDLYISESAAKSLREIGIDSPELIPKLIQLIFRYQFKEIQNNQLQAKNSDSIGAVAFSELTKEEKICGLVIQCLGEIGVGNPDVINILLKLLNQSQSDYLCSKVIESLEKISNGNIVVINALVKLLQTSQDWKLCSIAAESLGEIAKRHPEAISSLINLLHTYRHYDNFKKATKSLSKMVIDRSQSVDKIIDILISILQSK
ncbi:MAG: HEAT repeat domain-containing protein, partial [Rhizonema sp. PD38]|nr:HEAT repeat domain-containing protein [Rhizonema sp. PD38]